MNKLLFHSNNIIKGKKEGTLLKMIFHHIILLYLHKYFFSDNSFSLSLICLLILILLLLMILLLFLL